MSTLTHAHSDFGAELASAKVADATPARKSLFARLFDAIIHAQERRAEREMGRYLAGRGPLTDELEREIMRRLSGARRL